MDCGILDMNTCSWQMLTYVSGDPVTSLFRVLVTPATQNIQAGRHPSTKLHGVRTCVNLTLVTI